MRIQSMDGLVLFGALYSFLRRHYESVIDSKGLLAGVLNLKPIVSVDGQGLSGITRSVTPTLRNWRRSILKPFLCAWAERRSTPSIYPLSWV